ncbi:MAG TPA: VOC family protein [Candidatus Polarisedimenticolaceae bacterium]|nr:VOC family protein [Candidatus Polarisedimenticolaceae bacterium]
MIDHVLLNVRDTDASRRFYERALAPLGLGVVLAFPEGVGFGAAGRPEFWIWRREPVGAGVHVAFRCGERAQVDTFHAAALEAGGTDNGAPGPRPHYHPRYYGAFVLDPDGHNIEAVCHE